MSLTNDQLIDRILATLNEAVTADPHAVTALVHQRVPCNKKLADHPTIRCRQSKGALSEVHLVGMLGVLNGIVGVRPDGLSPIAAVVGSDGRTVVGFQRTPPRALSPR